MSDDQLILEHDQKAASTVWGVRDYLDELARRQNERSTNTMVRCTKWITGMTLVIMVLTALLMFSEIV